MAERSPKPTRREPEALKSIVDILRLALDRVPAALRFSCVIGGLVAVIGVVLVPVFLMRGAIDYAFWALLACLAALLVTLAIMFVSPSGSPDFQPAASPACPPGATVLRDICDRIRAQGPAADLDLGRMCCPDPQPVFESTLDQYSIYHLWADPRGGRIQAHLLKEENEPIVEIAFTNCHEGWASNVGIRPGGNHPFHRLPNDHYLWFDAKVPEPLTAVPSDVLALSIRIVDERNTHWGLGSSMNDLKCLKIEGVGTWKTYSLDLNASTWFVFPVDGNHGYPGVRPVLDHGLLALVLTPGSERGNQEPGPGSGRVQVRKIRYKKCLPGAAS